MMLNPRYTVYGKAGARAITFEFGGDELSAYAWLIKHYVKPFTDTRAVLVRVYDLSEYRPGFRTPTKREVLIRTHPEAKTWWE